MPVQQESIRSFLNYLRFEKRYSAHTILSYETDLIAFFDYLEIQYGPMDPGAVGAMLVRSWLAKLMEEGMSPRTIRRKMSALRSFYKHRLREGLQKTTPMTGLVLPKISKRLPVFVKEEDVMTLVETLNTGTEDWKSMNAHMLISIFYATGMRLSELIGLKEKQIDFSRGLIKVLGKGNKERSIPAAPELLEDMKRYMEKKRHDIEAPADTLLVTEKGKKLYPKYAYLLVNHYLESAKTLEKKSPHVLRHTFATHLMNHGADLNAVKELLGHSSLASTQVYTHNSIEKLKNVHRKAHPKA